MFKRIKNVILLLVCTMALVVPSVSSLAANIEPRAQYAYCDNCESMGVINYKTEVTEPEDFAWSGCQECGGQVRVTIQEIKRYYNCINCGFSYIDEDFIYAKVCGHK